MKESQVLVSDQDYIKSVQAPQYGVEVGCPGGYLKYASFPPPAKLNLVQLDSIDRLAHPFLVVHRNQASTTVPCELRIMLGEISKMWGAELDEQSEQSWHEYPCLSQSLP